MKIEVSYSFTVHKFAVIDIEDLVGVNGYDLNEVCKNVIESNTDYFLIDSSDEINFDTEYCEAVNAYQDDCDVDLSVALKELEIMNIRHRK